MKPNEIFNATVCIIGIAILLIHIVNLFIKKNKRKDEFRLLNFLLFTVLHFATYLTFTLVKPYVDSDAYIMGFYTTFYIFNNIEAFLLFFYMLSYVDLSKKSKTQLTVINSVVFGIFIVLDFVNLYTRFFFTSVKGEYTRNTWMIASQGYQFVMFALVFVVTVFSSKLVLREKIAFGLYCLLPVVAIILQNAFKGYAIAYLSIIVSIEILFFFLNVSKNIQLAVEQEKSKDAQIKIMMSQIQPHFVYNSLSSISTLISIDPKKAQETLDDFTEYLRHNLSSLTETKLIPFDNELRHIETYISLEKVRFNDRLNVIYDIKSKDFLVPPLSIQPIVENAIKHGILKKVEGGTLTLKTYEEENAYVIEVIDDGVGFDMNDVNFKNNEHLGINNIKYRLKTMCNGSFLINSEVGKGSTAIIKIYK